MEARRAFVAEMHNMLDVVQSVLSAGDVERVRFGMELAKSSPEMRRRVGVQLRTHVKPALEAETFEITEELINSVIPAHRKLKVDFTKVDEAMTARAKSCLLRLLAHVDALEKKGG
jgi:hypothetical protein